MKYNSYITADNIINENYTVECGFNSYIEHIKEGDSLQCILNLTKVQETHKSVKVVCKGEISYILHILDCENTEGYPKLVQHIGLYLDESSIKRIKDIIKKQFEEELQKEFNKIVDL